MVLQAIKTGSPESRNLTLEYGVLIEAIRTAC